MLIVFLACTTPEKPLNNVLTGADTASDTGEPRTELLDACVETGPTLTWSVVLPEVKATPIRIFWQDGTLVMLEGDIWGGARQIDVFDLPAPTNESNDLVFRWSITSDHGYAGLTFFYDKLIVGEGSKLRVLDLSTGATVRTVPTEARIRSLASDGTQVFGGTEGTPFRWDGHTLTHDPTIGVSDASAVAITPEGWWSAGRPLDGNVGFYDGSTLIKAPEFFGGGDTLDIVPRASGGVYMISEPTGYPWFAAFDSKGEMLQEPVWISDSYQIVSSPASAFTWSGEVKHNLGEVGHFVAIGDEQTWSSAPVGSEDILGIAIDPDGRWLLTTHADGTLKRWHCP